MDRTPESDDWLVQQVKEWTVPTRATVFDQRVDVVRLAARAVWASPPSLGKHLIHPGGFLLEGGRAQEETLCRSSALYAILAGDPMYEHQRKRPQPDSTDWAIYSPDVPVFRADDGRVLDQPWLLSFITCAAPYAPAIGQPQAGDLLQRRIQRVLAIAQALGYHALVLGAWGCGAFRNDLQRTARLPQRASE